MQSTGKQDLFIYVTEASDKAYLNHRWTGHKGKGRWSLALNWEAFASTTWDHREASLVEARVSCLYE